MKNQSKYVFKSIQIQRAYRTFMNVDSSLFSDYDIFFICFNFQWAFIIPNKISIICTYVCMLKQIKLYIFLLMSGSRAESQLFNICCANIHTSLQIEFSGSDSLCAVWRVCSLKVVLRCVTACHSIQERLGMVACFIFYTAKITCISKMDELKSKYLYKCRYLIYANQ